MRREIPPIFVKPVTVRGIVIAAPGQDVCTDAVVIGAFWAFDCKAINTKIKTPVSWYFKLNLFIIKKLKIISWKGTPYLYYHSSGSSSLFWKLKNFKAAKIRKIENYLSPCDQFKNCKKTNYKKC